MSDHLQRALLALHRRHRWKERLSLFGCVLFATAGFVVGLALITITAAHLVRWLSN